MLFTFTLGRLSTLTPITFLYTRQGVVVWMGGQLCPCKTAWILGLRGWWYCSSEVVPGTHPISRLSQ